MTDTPFLLVPGELLAMIEDGKLSHAGYVLYNILLRRVNRSRGDAKVWPSRRTLARQMGFTRTQSVDRYLAELVAAGLVLASERHREGTSENDTNLYTLLLLPPSPEVVRKTAPPSTQKRTTVVRRSAPRVVRESAHELDEVELDEEELDLSLREDDPDGSPVGAALDRERDSASPTSTPTTRAEALARFGVTDPAEVEKLIPLIEQINGVRNFGFWLTTTANGTLAECIQIARAKADVASRFATGPGGYAADSRRHGPWCGRCDQTDRMLDVGTPGYPKVTQCPTCHRDRVAAKPQKLVGLNTRDGSTDWDNLPDSELSFNPNR